MSRNDLNKARLDLRTEVKNLIKNENSSSFDRRCLHIASALLHRNPFKWDLLHEKVEENEGNEIDTIYLLNKESGRKVYVENKSMNSSGWNLSKMAYKKAMIKTDEVLSNIA